MTAVVGLRLQMTQLNGEPIFIMITDMSDDTITLDANPPLAGQTLFFEVELATILQKVRLPRYSASCITAAYI